MAKPPQRSSASAFLLGLLLPGLGHWYAGRMRIAIAFVIALALALPATVFICAGLGVHAGIWGVVAGAWVVRIASALHAAWVVRTGKSHVGVRGQSLLGYLCFAAVSLGFGMLGRHGMETYAFESFSIPSESMLPMLRPGDSFTVAKLLPRDREARRGDLVVFAPPSDPSVRFIKRVLGLPGETLTFPAVQPPTIDGIAMQWSPCPSESPRHQCWLETTPQGVQYEVYTMSLGRSQTDISAPVALEVPPGHVLLIGDNRQESADSRVFGPVPLASIEGRAVTRYLPWARRASLVPQE
ncbi:MAG: signal peptidase I [Nannocystaceae bacterium]|nr:signal peptidase I [Nannocystaceae bacterium]